MFNLQLGLVCTKLHRVIQYTPKKCSNSFVQSSVDAKRQSEENPDSGVVAETVKLLANRSYGYQIIEKSWHSVTKDLSDKATQSTNKFKLFKKLDDVNSTLHEVELGKAQIAHKEPIVVGFILLQYAKLRILELYYIFFTNFYDVNKLD